MADLPVRVIYSNFEVSLPQVSRYIIQYGLSHLEGQLMLVFRVERSVATKAFVIMVAITNCGLPKAPCIYQH